MKAGDVVVYSGKRVTIERIAGDKADVAWFVGSTLHRASPLLHSLKSERFANIDSSGKYDG